MGRKAAPQPLALSDTSAALGHNDLPLNAETTSQGVSPAESRSPKSPRSSPFHSRFSPLKSQDRKQHQHQHQHQQRHQQQQSQQLQEKHDPNRQIQPNDQQPVLKEAPSTYPPISAILDTPPAPPPKEKPATKVQHEAKKASKNGFFHFSKSSHKSPNHCQPHVHQNHHNHHNHTEARSQITPRGTDGTSKSNYGGTYALEVVDCSRLSPRGAWLELPSTSHPATLVPAANFVITKSDPTQSDLSLQKPLSPDPSRSDVSIASSADYDTSSPQSSRKGKPKPFGILTHTKSLHEGEGASPKESSTPTNPTGNEPELYLNSVPLRTATAGQDRSFRDMMSSAVRNRSEDRIPSRDHSGTRESHRERESKTQPSSLRENGGSNFLSGLKDSGSKAANILSKGLFGKNSRSSSTNEREPSVDDENYQLKVIILPLVEQTRLTRISKRLEDSRDKTEFWMPAFPWRAIDYLNYKGCEVEGLYRVPGSGPQVKKWQRKFDERKSEALTLIINAIFTNCIIDYDVNLFEDGDLYDINIIGSMLKAWLRELPDELFPKAAQERIARECAGATQVPKLLVEELSNLSPFNYYLLFAITCHLSLLLAHSDKNKMDFRNLCICFQPCMKIDAFCFRFLVCDWRDCWKGCKNESRYIEEEYRLFDQPPPRGLAEPQKPVPREPEIDRQQLSSSDSSKQSGLSPEDQRLRPGRKPLQPSESNGSMASNNSSISTSLTINSDREVPRGSGDLRPLSPIKPLSPLGF